MKETQRDRNKCVRRSFIASDKKKKRNKENMIISSHPTFWHLFCCFVPSPLPSAPPPPVDVLSGRMIITNQKKNKACIIVSGNAHRSKDTSYK